jgi:hypothetical protein
VSSYSPFPQFIFVYCSLVQFMTYFKPFSNLAPYCLSLAGRSHCFRWSSVIWPASFYRKTAPRNVSSSKLNGKILLHLTHTSLCHWHISSSLSPSRPRFPMHLLIRIAGLRLERRGCHAIREDQSCDEKHPTPIVLQERISQPLTLR